MSYTLNIKKYSLLITRQAVILKDHRVKISTCDTVVTIHSNTGHSNDLLTRHNKTYQKSHHFEPLIYHNRKWF